LARRSKDVNQSRRLLSLAVVRDGMDRGGAAKLGCMGRQTVRNRVHQRKFVNRWKMGYHVADPCWAEPRIVDDCKQYDIRTWPERCGLDRLSTGRPEGNHVNGWPRDKRRCS
jgi:hypothetical protein